MGGGTGNNAPLLFVSVLDISLILFFVACIHWLVRHAQHATNSKESKTLLIKVS